MNSLVLLVNVLLLLAPITIANSTDMYSMQQEYISAIESNYYAVPKKVANIKFLDENSKEIRFKDFKDKFVILNFWSNWCIECTNELKSLDKLQQELNRDKVDDVAIIAISDGSIR